MKALNLSRDVDLYISMTWNFEGQNHGMCGHIFEIVDYYLLLSETHDVRILLCEDIDWVTMETAIRNKYNLTSDEINQLKSHTIFFNRPDKLTGKNILFVDGGLRRSLYHRDIALEFDNILSFKCSIFDTFHDVGYDNMTVLQDNRVYDDDDIKIATNYKKKIYFDRYNDQNIHPTGTALVYVTKNCRKISDVELMRLTVKYKQFDKFMVLTSTPEEYKERLGFSKKFIFPNMPVDHIFEKFDTYIYTPTRSDLTFDCSPRFIAECKYYNRDVIYHNIDGEYLTKDTGLKWRRYDIDNDFQSIFLTSDDDIVDIVGGIV